MRREIIMIDGYHEIGAHVSSGIANLICLRQLFGSTTVENLKTISCFSSHVLNVFCATIQYKYHGPEYDEKKDSCIQREH